MLLASVPGFQSARSSRILSPFGAKNRPKPRRQFPTNVFVSPCGLVAHLGAVRLGKLRRKSWMWSEPLRISWWRDYSPAMTKAALGRFPGISWGFQQLGWMPPNVWCPSVCVVRGSPMDVAMLSILGSGWPATGVTPSEFQRQMGKNQC